MLAYSRYRTNLEVTCINQDVPTYFYAVQRSRLPIIAVLLDRGLSDTDRGEVNQIYPIKNTNKSKIFGSKIVAVVFPVFALLKCGKTTQQYSLAYPTVSKLHPTLIRVRRGMNAVSVKP